MASRTPARFRGAPGPISANGLGASGLFPRPLGWTLEPEFQGSESFPTYSPRQGDEVAINLQNTLSGGDYRLTEESFNSSLAHSTRNPLRLGSIPKSEGVSACPQQSGRAYSRHRDCGWAPGRSARVSDPDYPGEV